MINRCDESFLTKKAWGLVQKKIERSRNAWKKSSAGDRDE
jgi:hypothetical protein